MFLFYTVNIPQIVAHSTIPTVTLFTDGVARDKILGFE
eukprot:gene76-100_t